MFCFPDLICVAGLGGLVENITTLLKNLGEAESIKASNDATYGSKWTMFFVSLVVGVLFGIVFGIFQAICNAIGIGFITFVVMFILYVLAISISMSISASFWKQLKDNVE